MTETLLTGRRYERVEDYAMLTVALLPELRPAVGEMVHKEAEKLSDQGQDGVGVRLTILANRLGHASPERRRGDSWRPDAWVQGPSGSIGATFEAGEIRLAAGPGKGGELAVVCSREMYKDFEMELEFEWVPGTFWKNFIIMLPLELKALTAPVDRTEVGFYPEDNHFEVLTRFPKGGGNVQYTDVDWSCPGNGPVRVKVRRVGAELQVFCDGKELDFTLHPARDPLAPRQIRLVTAKAEAVVRNVRIRHLP